jgi:hypothetical protein
MVFSFENPKHLHTKVKEDYLTTGILTMTSSILQGGLLNTTKEEKMLSESSHSSAGGLWLDGVVFHPYPSTDAQHLLLYTWEEPSSLVVLSNPPCNICNIEEVIVRIPAVR